MRNFKRSYSIQSKIKNSAEVASRRGGEGVHRGNVTEVTIDKFAAKTYMGSSESRRGPWLWERKAKWDIRRQNGV